MLMDFRRVHLGFFVCVVMCALYCGGFLVTREGDGHWGVVFLMTVGALASTAYLFWRLVVTDKSTMTREQRR